MGTQLTFLIFLIFVASCTALLSEWPKKITVTEGNQHEFGLPLGTVLKKDKRTGRYIPPPPSDDFSFEKRLEVQFKNEATAPNFCRTGNTTVGEASTSSNLRWDQFCRSPDGEDLCCSKTKCSCDANSNSCACVNKAFLEYFEEKKERDFYNALYGLEYGTNIRARLPGVFAAGRK